jgi:hypothetical protein
MAFVVGVSGAELVREPQEDTMHAMISQAMASERNKDMRAQAANERLVRQTRRAGQAQPVGRVRRVLRPSRRLSATSKI